MPPDERPTAAARVMAERTMRARIAALQAAVTTHVSLGSPMLCLCLGVDRADTIAQAETDIRHTADTYLAWLQGTVRLRLVPGPIQDQSTGAPTGSPIPEGDTMQLHDNEKCTITADTEDAKGFDTPEVLEWSFDNADVASITVSEDTKSCTVVAGAPGSGVLTASIPALGLSATLAVDVVPGGTATIELVPGEVTEQ